MSDFHWVFNCISYCGSNRHQRCIGKEFWRQTNTQHNGSCVFVWLYWRYCTGALLVVLIYGLPHFLLIAALYSFGISFSNTLFLVPSPAVFIRIIICSLFSTFGILFCCALAWRNFNFLWCGMQSWCTSYPCLTSTEICLFDLSILFQVFKFDKYFMLICL